MCSPPPTHLLPVSSKGGTQNRTVVSKFRLKRGDALSLDRGVSHLVLRGIVQLRKCMWQLSAHTSCCCLVHVWFTGSNDWFSTCPSVPRKLYYRWSPTSSTPPPRQKSPQSGIHNTLLQLAPFPLLSRQGLTFRKLANSLLASSSLQASTHRASALHYATCRAISTL